jgi:formylglycine-generating enzyme
MKSDRRMKDEGRHPLHNALKPIGAVAFVVLLVIGTWWFSTAQSGRSPMVNQQSGMTCDMGISAAKSSRAPSVTNAQPIPPAGQPGLSANASSIVSNSASPPDPVPEGMGWIPGGEFWMGTEEFPDALPLHRVSLDGFWMDKTEVTNEQFETFVKATGYVTIAERIPRAEDFPGAPPENLVAGSVVFSPSDHPVQLNDHFQWWSYVVGANWRHPEGPQSTIHDRGNYPVVHVAYEDVRAYATWAGKRLPTEAEFEFAQRSGLDRKPYAWGEELNPGGQFMANTFQGHFPDTNTKKDGYEHAAPVAAFSPNSYGLYDMAGNVWEWTSDWYRPDYYEMLAAKETVAHGPQGPADSFDPSEPGVKKKVHKGGSYLCTDQYCARYIAGGRGKGEPDTGTNHLGFRCVLSPGNQS